MTATDLVSAAQLHRWLQGFADAVADKKEWLTELDSAIGDADHGINMDRGMRAVTAKVGDAAGTGPGDLLKTVGMTLVSTVGGASGPLYGTFFLRAAGAAGTADTADNAVSAEQLGQVLRAGYEGVVARGKAELEDKTMVDALLPALEAYEAAVGAGQSAAAAAEAAAAAAERGRDATTPLVARKGRASYLGERSIGHTDPGAASTALLMAALADALRKGDG